MMMLWIVLPLAFLLAGGAIALFVWCVRSGQLDDLETPAYRMLLDEDQ